MPWKRPGLGLPRLALFFVPWLLERHAGLRHPDGRPGDGEEGDGPKNGTCFGDGQEEMMCAFNLTA